MHGVGHQLRSDDKYSHVRGLFSCNGELVLHLKLERSLRALKAMRGRAERHPRWASHIDA